MNANRVFVALDPVTDEVLYVCSGGTPDGRCPRAAQPPYICQGLRIVAVQGTGHDGLSFTVNEMAPGRCPAAWVDELPAAATN
ncbi:MAG TPA: hypothetical protein VET65_07730 [Candidatus Limnocylindrales bacterium]|nr:hypothetical protein [Candidatus Limnocylindrales bacterium]